MLPGAGSGSLHGKIMGTPYTDSSILQNALLQTSTLLLDGQAFPVLQPGAPTPESWRPSLGQCASLHANQSPLPGFLQDYDGENRVTGSAGPDGCPEP
jgi:hypothetical protein